MTPRWRAALLVGGWVLAVVAGSALTWVAVDLAGRAVLQPVAAGQARAAGAAADGGAGLPEPTASADLTPGATPVRTPDAPASGPPPAPSTTSSPAPQVVEPVTGTRGTAGGTVAVTCRGTAADLQYATPATGWSVDQDNSSNPSRVRVRFVAGDDGEQREIRLEAFCSGGPPAFTVEEHS